MVVPPPHYLLFCAAELATGDWEWALGTQPVGRWRFSLQRLDRPEQFEASDVEAESSLDRLNLLAVVRGLEALDHPSSVTLVTPSRYVVRGMRYGLASWRERDYTWERFGEVLPIRNAELWQRVDRALQFHAVNCRPLPAALYPATVGRDLRSTEQVAIKPGFAERISADQNKVASNAMETENVSCRRFDQRPGHRDGRCRWARASEQSSKVVSFGRRSGMELRATCVPA